MKCFAKIVHRQKPITVFAKCFIVDVWQSSECAFKSHAFAFFHVRWITALVVCTELFDSLKVTYHFLTGLPFGSLSKFRPKMLYLKLIKFPLDEIAEALFRRCSVKKVCQQLYWKRDSGTGVFLRILRNF